MFEKLVYGLNKIMNRFFFLVIAFGLIEVGFNDRIFFYGVMGLAILWFEISNEKKENT